MDLQQAALSTCTIVFVLSSMLGLGFGLRVSEIVAPLRNVRLVALSLVANFVVMPALALAALQTLLNLRSVAAVFGTFGILAAVLFIAGGYVAGWVLGGPALETRVVLGLGTAQRNIAASLVVASQSFDDPAVVVMVIVV